MPMVFFVIFIASIGIIIIIILIIAILRAGRATKATTKAKAPIYHPTATQPYRTIQGSAPAYNPYRFAQQPTSTFASSRQQPTPQKIGRVYCRFCGDETTSEATFCPKCGSKL